MPPHGNNPFADRFPGKELRKLRIKKGGIFIFNLYLIGLIVRRKAMLSCSVNRLTELDVSNCAALTELSCYSNRLAELDVSKNANLANLDCYSQKTSLELMPNGSAWTADLSKLVSKENLSRITKVSAGEFDADTGLVTFRTEPASFTYYMTTRPGFQDMEVTVTLMPHTHSYGDWQTTKVPTCTEDGIERRECSVCNYFEERGISATGHKWKETGRTDATCTEDGSISYVCENDPAHTKQEAITALGHEWKTEWTVDQPATCTEAGSQSHHCTRCDEKNDVTPIPATGHSFGDWQTVESPSCTDKGSEKRVCTECGFTEARELDALGHDWEEAYTVDKEPTCTAEGSESIHCKNCDAVKDSRTLAALGHDYEESVTKQPTCTEKGVKTFTCRHDETHTYTEEIAALGHDFSEEWTIDKEATETEAGSKSHHCSRCGARKDVTVIPATGPAGQPEDPDKPEIPQTGEKATGAVAAALVLTAGGALFLSTRSRRKAKHAK